MKQDVYDLIYLTWMYLYKYGVMSLSIIYIKSTFYKFNHRIMGLNKYKEVLNNVVQIDFEGYIQNRFAERNTANLWSEVKELGVFLEEEFGREEDLQSLKGFHKKLKGCRVWGEAKKKKSKKRKRMDNSGGSSQLT